MKRLTALAAILLVAFTAYAGPYLTAEHELDALNAYLLVGLDYTEIYDLLSITIDAHAEDPNLYTCCNGGGGGSIAFGLNKEYSDGATLETFERRILDIQIGAEAYMDAWGVWFHVGGHPLDWLTLRLEFDVAGDYVGAPALTPIFGLDLRW